MSFEQIGEAAERVVSGLAGETAWNGKTIANPGVYAGIPIETYHHRRDLLDGPSISKSALKYLLPTHGGSPKAFWGRWAWNENHVKSGSSAAMEFGKAVHFLLLGEDNFRDFYVVRPAIAPDGRAWNGNNNSCREWLVEQAKAGLTVITEEQLDTIRRMAADAAENPMVKQGILNGRVERSMFAKDPETGIWLRARPDVIPAADSIFADLKSTSSMDEEFLERQIFDLGYYLQAAMTRIVCRLLDIPFSTFVLVYVLNDDVTDTAHVELHERVIDRGEESIRWCLRTIKRCMDAGEWPGREPFRNGEIPIQMKPWSAERIDFFLDQQAKLEQAA